MREKYLGSILGLAVNDALGMATESKTKEEIKSKLPLVQEVMDKLTLENKIKI